MAIHHFIIALYTVLVPILAVLPPIYGLWPTWVRYRVIAFFASLEYASCSEGFVAGAQDHITRVRSTFVGIALERFSENYEYAEYQLCWSETAVCDFPQCQLLPAATLVATAEVRCIYYGGAHGIGGDHQSKTAPSHSAFAEQNTAQLYREQSLEALPRTES
ncbi:hypothetical protein EXIGLDRAFT_708126 [Exidia glandulosa HHB12029]|uniref:Uncharacterized protein n=1 Tax=Exidia glandulosa HHB12029 TaxID=1314781 RepID=A0A166N9L8_EXIGL|nr:hypothetical protein EXIGLDRAFT_708126 [Exidia glandulosa HHB12029]